MPQGITCEIQWANTRSVWDTEVGTPGMSASALLSADEEIKACNQRGGV